MTDKGVNPGHVERAFRKSNWASYTQRTSQQHAKAGMAEHEGKLERLRSDVEALEAMQAKRALKPPGRR